MNRLEHMKRILIYLFIGFLLSQATWAQRPFFNLQETGKQAFDLNLYSIFEDQTGVLWLGTRQGLLKYNGAEFDLIQKNDTTSRQVSAIFQDDHAVLWVGYDDGTIYTFEKNELHFWKRPVEVPIIDFATMPNGRFCVATYGEGLVCFDDRQTTRIGLEEGLSAKDIYVMIHDRKDRLWLGTDGGLTICEWKGDQLSLKNIGKKEGLPDEIVKSLLEDSEGNIWVGTYEKGFCKYIVDNDSFKYFDELSFNSIINEMVLFEGQELWIATNDDGLWRYNFPEKKISKVNHQDVSFGNRINDLHIDVEGNIWVATHQHQLWRANRQFENIQTDLAGVQALLSGQDNRLWAGTENGLYTIRFDQSGASYYEPHLPNLNLNVISLYLDAYGNIWIGTFGDGVYCYDPKTKKIKRLTELDGLTNNSILSIAGLNSKIWLATLGGVTEITLNGNLFDIKKPAFRNFNQESGLGTNFIYKVMVDSRKRIWFATDGKGISMLDQGRITNYPLALVEQNGQPVEVPLKAVYAIAEDHLGNIWLSTASEGIFEFDGTGFRHLALKEGIRNLEITGLVTDNKGNVLIIHPTGIDLLDPETHHLIYYDDEVGVDNLHSNINGTCVDQMGHIWIAGQQKIIRYTPLKESLEIHPRTILSKVSVFLEPIDLEQDTAFAHDQNNLIFEFAGIWYTDQSTVKYQYQLEGYDFDWIPTSDRRATYSNLPPGDYTFKVTSTENDFFSDEPIASFRFRVDKPFWLQWWFILGVLIAGGALFYAWQKERDRRLQRVGLLEKEKAESQLAAIKAQINPHFLFNNFNTLVTIIEEDSDKAVEYVENLSDFYRTIMLYRDKKLIPVQEEIELVNNYSFLIHKRFGDSFNLSVNINGEPLLIAPLTLQTLVENAVKHNVISKTKPLYVDISFLSDADKGTPGKRGPYITVTNNLNKKKATGLSTRFGLQSLMKRYELLCEKKVLVEENDQQFKVKIPAIYNESL